MLQIVRPRPEEADRVLPQHGSRRPRGGGARQHVQAAPQAKSPGGVRPEALPQERQAAVDPDALGRGETESWLVVLQRRPAKQITFLMMLFPPTPCSS